MPSIISPTTTHESFLQIEAEYDKKNVIGEFADSIMGVQILCIPRLSNHPKGPVVTTHLEILRPTTAVVDAQHSSPLLNPSCLSIGYELRGGHLVVAVRLRALSATTVVGLLQLEAVA